MVALWQFSIQDLVLQWVSHIINYQHSQTHCSHDIWWYNIHIISYYIILYHIISYHIIPFNTHYHTPAAHISTHGPSTQKKGSQGPMARPIGGRNGAATREPGSWMLLRLENPLKKNGWFSWIWMDLNRFEWMIKWGVPHFGKLPYTRTRICRIYIYIYIYIYTCMNIYVYVHWRWGKWLSSKASEHYFLYHCYGSFFLWFDMFATKSDSQIYEGYPYDQRFL